MGVSPLSWSDFAAWAQLRRVQLAPWEWQILRDIETAVVAAIARHQAERANKRQH